MKRKNTVLLSLLFLVLSIPSFSREQRGISKVLNTRENFPQKYVSPREAVKTFFTAMKDKDFDLAWESLSSVSQNQLVQEFARSRKISAAQARELFDKNKEAVRIGFWEPLRERSKIIPLVQDAVYTLTDQKENEAMVEMKSGGITHHLRAVKEGKEWRMAYVESALQDTLLPPRPASESKPS